MDGYYITTAFSTLYYFSDSINSTKIAYSEVIEFTELISMTVNSKSYIKLSIFVVNYKIRKI